MTAQDKQIANWHDRLVRTAIALSVLVMVFFVARWSFAFMLDDQAPKWVTTLVAIAVGVCGVWIFFWIFNEIISLIPGEKARERLRPLVFVGPALALLIIYLIYPAINTIYLSFFDARSENFVGLKNYAFIFTSPQVQVAFRNNILWIVVVTSVCVTLGLIIAVLVDRIQLESIAKSIIFLPMAISSVGASIIWRFVYAYQPAGRAQIGILNAIVVALGGQPVGWFLRPPLNNFALMVIMIWLQTGFCMVVISAALKAVPGELLEAARIDGANEFQAFLRVTVPYIKGTLITVGTTVLIAVLKVFDIVYVMTRGNFNTEVIANRMFLEMYRFYNFGRGSALAVLLFLAVAPVMIINVRNLRRQRS